MRGHRQTHRQTDTLITILCSLLSGAKKLALKWLIGRRFPPRRVERRQWSVCSEEPDHDDDEPTECHYPVSTRQSYIANFALQTNAPLTKKTSCYVLTYMQCFPLAAKMVVYIYSVIHRTNLASCM